MQFQLPFLCEEKTCLQKKHNTKEGKLLNAGFWEALIHPKLVGKCPASWIVFPLSMAWWKVAVSIVIINDHKWNDGVRHDGMVISNKIQRRLGAVG